MTFEEAIDKVTKLLRLSKSDNPHEAALAAARAQEILARFSIDAAAIEMENKDKQPTEEIQDNILDGGERNASRWKTYLSSTLARFNQCKIYCYGPQINIIGRLSDVQKIRYMYQWLVKEIDSLTLANGKGLGKSWCNNFRLGVVSGIEEQLKKADQAARDAARQEVANNTFALVRVNNAIARLDERAKETNEFYEKKFPKMRKKNWGGSNYQQEAIQKGKLAGENINLGAKNALGSGQKKLKD